MTTNLQDGQKHNRGRIERIQTVDSDDECYDVSDEVNTAGVFFNMSFWFFLHIEIWRFLPAFDINAKIILFTDDETKSCGDNDGNKYEATFL